MKKNVLITGGSGFIGSNLKSALSENNFKVLTIGRSKNEDVQFDLKDPKITEILKDFLPDIVFHFASGTNIARAEEDKEKEFSDTVIATRSLLDFLKKLNKKQIKFIYLSSQSVYGIPEFLPVSENHKLIPVTVYGKNKLMVENTIIESSLDYIIFRVSSVFGGGQDFNKSGAIAKFIYRLSNNQSPKIFNSEDTVSDYIYINDLINALLKTIDNLSINKKVFNLGSGKPTSLKEVLNILYQYFPSAPKPELIKNALYLSDSHKGLYLDISKIKKELSWSPIYSINEGLKEMLGSIKHIEKV